MNNQSSFDRALLIPIGVGVFSLIGICVILIAGRITNLRGSVEEVPTATSFQYALIGTEPLVLTVTDAGPVEELPTFTPRATPILLATRTATQFVPIVTLATVAPTTTPSRTPTTASAAPFGAGTYDDLDQRFVYNGEWIRQSAVTGAFQNTLHISDSLGSAIFFRFIGQELRVFFQAGPSLGVIRLNLDGTNYEMNQSSPSTQVFEWVLPGVSNGTHIVTITHLSGGSVNLDYIIVPEVPATPVPPTITNTPLNQ